MKKIYLSLLILSHGMAGALHAQNNTFPSSGNVGVGTTAPLSLFTVTENVVVGTNGTAQIEAAPIGNGTSSVGLVSKLRMRGTFDDYPSDQSPRVAAQIQAGFLGGAWSNEYLAFQVGGSNDGGGDPKEHLRITAAGNIGINRSNPAGTLDLQASSATNAYTAPSDQADVRVLSSNDRSLDGAILELGGSSGATAYIKSEVLSGNSGALTFGTRLNNNDATMQAAVTIAGGNVGIGMTAPGYLLDVNGTIHSREVIVDTSGADFVFSSSYRLPPLSEVEKSILRDKHLPGIPSSTEMQHGGMGLGELETRLLQKIEELTLHEIEQQKRLDAQDREIARLDSEVARLSK